MPGTRASARIASNGNSSPPAKDEGTNKRKADSSPTSTKSKRGKKSDTKQQTIEETLDTAENAGNAEEQDQPQDIEMKEAGNGGEGENAQPNPVPDVEPGAQNGGDAQGKEEFKRDPGCWGWVDKETYEKKVQTSSANGDKDKTMKPLDSFKGKNREGESMDDPEKALKDSRGGAGMNVEGKHKRNDDLNAADVAEKGDKVPDDDTHERDETAPSNAKTESSDNKNGGAIEESKERADAQPSNILEKGLIYFFTRNRVNIDDAESVQDLQRSYFVLRPLPEGAKLGDGAINELKNNRLLALPKKVWPKSGKDRFMVFVEKAQTTIADLKENFFSGSEYQTQTTGTSQQSPVTPLGEGVYAITRTSGGSESHLAYMLTIPKEPGEMQEDVGIRSKGSFIMSLKNPEVKGPANAALPQKPDFPKEFITAFRGRGWMPTEPQHLDYANAQILLIGENIDSHALEATAKDEKDDSKTSPAEEMEKLENEDEIRVEHLKGDDTVFVDLGLSSKEYESVQTTW